MTDLRSQINVTDDEITARFDEIYGQDEGTTTIAEIAFVTDTIDEFRTARKGYNEPGELVDDEDGIFQVRRAQPLKGDVRRDFLVIDFGAARGVIGLKR